MTEPSHAVFLSYASEDAAGAERIAGALRAAGIEVWFDKSELRGGDAWDRQIRKQIHDCALFIAIISAHSDARKEGYFRREWKLAVERTADMAEDVPFLLPVVIDDTKDPTARVPDRFRDVQWSHLPGGEPSAAFVEHVRRLLAPEVSNASSAVPVPGASSRSLPTSRHHARVRSRAWIVLAAVLAAVAVGYFAIDRLALKRSEPSAPVSAPSTAAASFNPPPHSIAVLPFVNMSGEKDQEYFSDGLSEELLNSLARINELQVAARTSSFYFKGEHADLATIAHKLNVASILEGSVRRAGHTVRVTAQLNNAVTGFHLWSQTYDRDLGDVLKLQSEIADAVVGALKVTLLSDTAAKIQVGGTSNPAAFDAYLRASKAFREAQNDKDLQTVLAGYAEAVRLDPGYALAYADRSLAFTDLGRNWTADLGARRDYFNKAQVDARKASTLAPNLAQGHLALALLFESSLEYLRAAQEYQRALALEPGNAMVLTHYSEFATDMGQTEAGLGAARRAVALDPLNSDNHFALGAALVIAHRFPEAIAVFTDAKALTPNSVLATSWLGFAYYSAGDLQNALAVFESARPVNDFNRLLGLSMTYDKLGRHADADTTFAQLRTDWGNSGAVFYAMVYAQWGDMSSALEWLGTAIRLQDPYLNRVRMNAFFDPLRKEPRFQAIERELKFPN